MVGEYMAQNGEGQHVLVPNQRHRTYRTRRTYRGMQAANCGNMFLENRDTYEPSGLVASSMAPVDFVSWRQCKPRIQQFPKPKQKSTFQTWFWYVLIWWFPLPVVSPIWINQGFTMEFHPWRFIHITVIPIYKDYREGELTTWCLNTGQTCGLLDHQAFFFLVLLSIEQTRVSPEMDWNGLTGYIFIFSGYLQNHPRPRNPTKPATAKKCAPPAVAYRAEANDGGRSTG